MTDIFIRLEEQLFSGLPFALFAKPCSNTLTGVFQNNRTVYKAETLLETGFVFAPFSEGETILIPYRNADVIINKITADEVATTLLSIPEADSKAKADFEQLVINCIDAIKSDRFKKLVASRTETIQTESNTIAIFKRLLGTYPNAFRYLFYSPASGLWMGATPEQLLKAKHNTIHTVALAGTQVYNAEETAVWADKERQEQQFVTDYLIKQLGEFSADIRTTEPYTYRAGNLVHIKTDVTAELKKEITLNKVINKLHPTPAVCGLPKKEAMQFLLTHEGYNREYYSGFLGELNHNFSTSHTETDLFVNLRSMKLDDKKAQLFVGCGITKDSDPTKEFYETVNKSITMRKVL